MGEQFEKLKDRCIYQYIRGSHAYGLNIETSDVDMGGIYIAPNEQVYGLPMGYKDMVQDSKGDKTWYEIGKFMQMLIKSNPTVLESLFVDDKFVIYEHPIMTEIKKHRDAFITKDCFGAFIGYAIEQIKKARGLNKKIVEEPIKKHLHPLDFCYTFYKQGSQHIKVWLLNYGLRQEYCGLVNIPNMVNTYGVYYDFGMHMACENDWVEDKSFIDFAINYFKPNWFIRHGNHYNKARWLIRNIKPIGYRGMVGKDDNINIEDFEGKPKIFDLRLSSIDDKNTKPICFLHYNSNGYTDHCKKYKEYKEWEQNRNPQRFKENQGKEFDRKNIAHCIRLLHMGIEIAKTGKMNVNRTDIDRDFILNVRLGNTQYDEIINYIEEKKAEMIKAMNESKLPEHVDTNLVNDILIKARNDFNNI